MAEKDSNPEVLDVQEDLDRIKALGGAIGTIMFDHEGEGINSQDVGMLAFMVMGLAIQVSEKINEWLVHNCPPPKGSSENGQGHLTACKEGV